MRIELTLLVTSAIIVLAVGCASHSFSISCQVRMPDKFQQDPPGWKSPTGEPESVRYTKSYEAFWWNCVMLKAKDPKGRCPSTCSGTPAANYGCLAGARDAERQITQLVRVHDKTKVQHYLQSLASDPEGAAKIKPYFPDGPRAEKIIK